jgi:hypothetical protein
MRDMRLVVHDRVENNAEQDHEVAAPPSQGCVRGQNPVM